MANLDYRGLAVLDAVSTQGSFEKAALALGISQSAVSQRIKTLEDGIGRLLVVRGTPSVPTGLGQRLVAHYRHVKLMEAALDIDLGQEVSMPEIALAIDGDSLATWFAQAMAPLLAPPRCQLRLQQHGHDHALQLLREGAVFGCVAADNGPELAQGAGTALGLMRYRCVATRAFANHWFGDGMLPAALALAPAVASEALLLARFLNTELGVAGAVPHHSLPLAAARECIDASLAYGLLPAMWADPAIVSGELVDLRPGAWLDVALSWHAWQVDAPFARALSEQVVSGARRLLVQS